MIILINVNLVWLVRFLFRGSEVVRNFTDYGRRCYFSWFSRSVRISGNWIRCDRGGARNFPPMRYIRIIVERSRSPLTHRYDISKEQVSPVFWWYIRNESSCFVYIVTKTVYVELVSSSIGIDCTGCVTRFHSTIDYPINFRNLSRSLQNRGHYGDLIAELFKLIGKYFCLFCKLRAVKNFIFFLIVLILRGLFALYRKMII